LSTRTSLDTKNFAALQYSRSICTHWLVPGRFERLGLIGDRQVMKRRWALLTIGGMFAAGRSGYSAVNSVCGQSIQTELGVASRELRAMVTKQPDTNSMIDLCNVLTDRCQAKTMVPPALAQATLDACNRSANLLAPSIRTDRIRSQTNEFGQKVRRFIEITAG
jgi:hypothetical protein